MLRNNCVTIKSTSNQPETKFSGTTLAVKQTPIITKGHHKFLCFKSKCKTHLICLLHKGKAECTLTKQMNKQNYIAITVLILEREATEKQLVSKILLLNHIMYVI